MKKFLIIWNIIWFGICSEICFASYSDDVRVGFTERSDCGVLYEMSGWKYNERWNDWENRQHWFGSDGWITGTGVGLYSDSKSKSYSIIQDPRNSAVLIYIGPWKKITLTYPTHFWEEAKQTEVEIRLIATQKGKSINSFYETKDDSNKNIPQQRLVLLEPSDDLIALCKLRWAERFGYNAVADYKLNPFRFFGGKVLIGSGKIIDSETGEIIADEKGNLIKTDISE